jgi:hypothetical protein
MANQTYIELDWEEQYEPLYGSPIVIPANTLLWRGYDKRYESVSDRFAYYSSGLIAFEYAKQSNRELGGFVTTQPLQLLDIRFLRSILSRIIQTNQADVFINDFASCMISFGLCSLQHQIKLVKMRYQDIITLSNEKGKQMKQSIEKMIKYCDANRIIEQEGIRVAETTNDGVTMAFLQELCKGWCDGFLSPRLQTVFHVEKGGELSPEMIIFHPKRSGIQQIKQVPLVRVEKEISSFIRDKHRLINMKLMKSGSNISTKMFVSGGNGIKKVGKHPLDEFEDRLHKKDKKMVEMYEMAKQAGKRWNKTMAIINPERMLPEMEINTFTSNRLE